MQCLACELTAGDRAPGGRVHQTARWVVEHCVGPLGVGALVVKPLRHCLHVGALTGEESAELGPLLRATSACVQDLTQAEQVYVCLWSHHGGAPGHIHFVVQPSWRHLEDRYGGLGPTLQAEQFRIGDLPDPSAVADFCQRARAWHGWAARGTAAARS